MSMYSGVRLAEILNMKVKKSVENYEDRFKGYYLETQPPVHSKIYSRCNKSDGFLGFSGSSHYSQAGFLESTPQINQ